MPRQISAVGVFLLLLALALCPATMMAFTRNIRTIPMRLTITRVLSRRPRLGVATVQKYTNGVRREYSLTALQSTSTMSGWTVQEAIDTSIQRLIQNNVTEPDYSALYLMAASLDLPWERGIRDLERSNSELRSTTLTPDQASSLESMLQLRENHEPIQYVLGQWDFLDYTVSIRKPLLCPRPETEELVLMVASETKGRRGLRILDVGCGTGVIGVSLAELLEDAQVKAIDVEPIAVETSMENAQRVLQDRSESYQATLVSAGDYTTNRRFDIVVSNPPYIPRSDMDSLTEDVVRYESDTALCGGMDGLDVIKTIIEQLPAWCNSGATCWMEVDPSHPKLIEDYLASRETQAVTFESSFQDMFGKDRFVKLKVQETK